MLNLLSSWLAHFLDGLHLCFLVMCSYYYVLLAYFVSSKMAVDLFYQKKKKMTVDQTSLTYMHHHFQD